MCAGVGEWKLKEGSDTEIGEAWIQQHTRAMSDGFKAQGLAPNEFFFLPRSAWSGSQAFSAGLWSGDIRTSCSHCGIHLELLLDAIFARLSMAVVRKHACRGSCVVSA